MTMKMTQSLWPVLAIALAAGCAGTHLNQSFAAPYLHDGPFKHVVTIAITADHGRRVAMEDALAGQLRQAGVQAEPSYKLLGDAAAQGEDSIRELLTTSGFDAVVMMRATTTNEDDVWVPGSVAVAPMYYRTMWDYYAHWHSIALERGRLAADHAVHVETVMFETPEGDLVYSAVSQTLNPGSPEDLVRQVGDRVAKDLAAKGLISNGHPHN
jgi:hypothetical protein